MQVVANQAHQARVLWSMHYHEKVFMPSDSGATATGLPEGLGVVFEGSALFRRPGAGQANAKQQQAVAKVEHSEGEQKTGDDEQEQEQANAQTQAQRMPQPNKRVATTTGELASLHYEAALLTAESFFRQICPEDSFEFFPPKDRGEQGGGDGVGGSAFDEGGDWDAVEVEGADGQQLEPGGGPQAGTE